ncbi:ComEC/Rec2 family competence protein [Tenacibaculum aquimarinum]|uniref:ComEC/Rec2 family competence protein n=1 Tax=Tenacibaculum aquimarinum TaxID=2910675 RepID=UPI001F0A965E|nr:ComEC/Rec2 family competence protein [Tenacibaculum aquimarinum]MCH3884215.1 competence protein ComEC family protein [Tenacibaculum aquimarinum]
MEKLLKYLPFHFLLCLIIGISIQYYTNGWQFGAQNLGFLTIFFMLILLLFSQLKRKKIFTLSSWVFFVFIGVLIVYNSDKRNSENYYNIHLEENVTAILTIDKILKPGNYYDKYEAEVSQINEEKTVGKVLLNIPIDSLRKTLNVDDKLFLKPSFTALIPSLNPHQFNYKEYLARQGIYHQVFVNNHQFKIVDKRSFSLYGLASKVRFEIQKSLKKYNFKDEEYAVINALLLGQRQDVSKQLINEYSRAGAIHILAVSGLHVGIVLLILNWLFKRLDTSKIGRFSKTILIITLLWMFAFIAGLSASVVRAVTMFTFVAIGQSFKRKRIVEHSLIASMFLLLLIKPLFLFDVGFQLSYLAVFGIIWVQPRLYGLWQPKVVVLDKGWQLFTVSIAAQMGILPISLYYFHQFPGLFLLSNLVIIPFLGTILIGGIIVIMLSLFEVLPQFVADSYGFVISLMNTFVSWISKQESFLFSEISMSGILMLAWYFVIIFGFLFLIEKRPKKLVFWLISIVIVQSFVFYGDFQKKKKHEFIVFHKNKKSVLGERVGDTLHVFHNLNATIIKEDKMLTSYKVGEAINLKYETRNPSIFQFKNQHIIVIDSLGIYKVNSLKNPIVILQNSPKINLERLIVTLNPKEIIADGSNYKSYIKSWQVICTNTKTPFYPTGKNGAYIIKN